MKHLYDAIDLLNSQPTPIGHSFDFRRTLLDSSYACESSGTLHREGQAFDDLCIW